MDKEKIKEFIFVIILTLILGCIIYFAFNSFIDYKPFIEKYG